MRISCVIPTLGRGKILCETVRMLLCQSHPPDEIIIVDQTAKPDQETGKALAEWEKRGAIRWLRQSEPNASLARNTGACIATGNVLVFLDDDILIGPHFLESYAKAFSDPAVQAVAGQILEGERQTSQVLSAREADPEIGWLYFRKNYSERCNTTWMASGNFAVRRERFLEVGGMDANYHRGAYREESDFAMRFCHTGGRFLFEPAASIYHLGRQGAPVGGSRNWIRNKQIAGWHHCVGDWYFTLKFINWNNWHHLLNSSVRHFVLNRYNVSHPWLLLPLLLRWMAALPRAVYLRWRGPRLIEAASIKPC